jgi:hypothetical protein
LAHSCGVGPAILDEAEAGAELFHLLPGRRNTLSQELILPFQQCQALPSLGEICHSETHATLGRAGFGGLAGASAPSGKLLLDGAEQAFELLEGLAIRPFVR